MEYQEPIERLTDPSEIKKRMKEECKKFNLIDFFTSLSRNYDDAALGIITSKQTIYLPVEDMHQLMVKKVYEQLYGSFLEGKKITDTLDIWLDEAMKKDNIILEFCSLTGNMCYIPKTITKKQFIEFNNFLNQIKTINEKLKNENGELIDIYINITNKAFTGMDESFMKQIKDKIQNRVDLNKKDIVEENIINDETGKENKKEEETR